MIVAPSEHPSKPVIVGWDSELAVLEAFLARPAGGAAALLLSGEAGKGKTTLWLVAVRQARDGGDRVLVAHPTESRSRVSCRSEG